MGFPRRLLAEGETLVLQLRPHVKRLLGSASLFLAVIPSATFLTAIVPDGQWQAQIRWAIVVAALLALLRWSVWPFLSWWSTIYVVTDRRLIMRSGVLNRWGHDMPLGRLNDITFTRGLIDRILGCGDLVVHSAGEQGQLVLDDIPRVEQVQRTLYRLSDEARYGPESDDRAHDPRPWPGGDADHWADDDTGAGADDPGTRSRRRSWWGRGR